MKRKIFTYTSILAALLLAFSLKVKSQSPQVWRFVNNQPLQDGGPYIGEAQNTVTGESYVVVWNLSGIAITPKSGGLVAPSLPSLPPPTGGPTALHR